MDLIYVIGPISADSGYQVEWNIRHAEELVLQIHKLGASAICMHSFSRFHQGLYTHEEMLPRDLEVLSRCDAGITVDGWEKSKGSLIEMNFCQQNEIPVFHSLMLLKGWLRGRAS